MKDFNEEFDNDEQEIYKKLKNPDKPKNLEENKYPFGFDYQQEIIGMLLMDETFLIQSLQLIKPKYFVEKTHEIICSVLFDHFQSYKSKPSKVEIMEQVRKRYPENEMYNTLVGGELEFLTSNYISGLSSREFCLEQITYFAKKQALRTAIAASLDDLKDDTKDSFDKIEKRFREAFMVDRSFDLGLNYYETLEERYERMQKQLESKEVFLTGFPSIDNGLAAGGMCRGEMGAIVAHSGVGKSLMLVKIAVQNLMRGKKVLYVSLEMDQDKIAKRFDAQLACHNINSLLENKDTIIHTLKDDIKDSVDKKLLIIKQFPAGACDVNMIRGFCATLELHGFKPDLILVDYLGEMKDDPIRKTYENRQIAVRDLRGFAVESKTCLLTAVQPNRSGKFDNKSAELISEEHLSESFGIVRPLDFLWSINQNIEEKALNVGRMHVIKHRDGKSKYFFPFRQNPATLDLSEIDQVTYSTLRSSYVQKKTDDTEPKKFKPNG